MAKRNSPKKKKHLCNHRKRHTVFGVQTKQTKKDNSVTTHDVCMLQAVCYMRNSLQPKDLLMVLFCKWDVWIKKKGKKKTNKQTNKKTKQKQTTNNQTTNQTTKQPNTHAYVSASAHLAGSRERRVVHGLAIELQPCRDFADCVHQLAVAKTVRW